MVKERNLNIETIKEFETIGELKRRVKEVEEFNKISKEQKQADKNLTKICREVLK